ncbi:MAG: hypothetical protein QOD94_2408, partial [Alphaproteobacteria bacterium]|nr:hypothetical protein [Alphaproteobacteria bacterium]
MKLLLAEIRHNFRRNPTKRTDREQQKAWYYPIALVWCTSWIAFAQAQTLPQPPQVASNKTIDLGGRGFAPPEATSQEASKDENEGLKFSAKAGVASDYVYR